MINRLYVEKKPGLSPEAKKTENELREFLGIKNLKKVRILNRYDVEDLSEDVYERAKNVVFAEPQVDLLYEEEFEVPQNAHRILNVEVLPGQFDQRADSASQCIQLLAGGERPLIRYAKVYILEGDLSESDLEKISGYLINPVEARKASEEKPETLKREFKRPEDIKIIENLIQMDREALEDLRVNLGLAMDLEDLRFLQEYFRDIEKRDPTLTEVRVIDTYWSDHCRHTTFSTELKNIEIEDDKVKEAFERYLKVREELYDDERPITLMDLATIGTKKLKREGKLPELDESEEINACSIRIPVKTEKGEEDWLVMFKNETHNHPTEIEPFGGAATCIGGCIRDPLSGRVYVHQAMRLTGGADPRAKLEETIEGRLPQRKIAQTAAEGYSSYGNQIGLATGHVSEVYHPGYVAKHFECGAVVGAAPAENVVRERPESGDSIILLGGRTGRDGIGGATGSSKEHNLSSLTTMASEVQKGNAPEERKLQRLFRKPEITKLIKRCNDFGAGGVSVAIGELADGLEIDLDKVRKKYEGLDGTELAISESQERMAVVVKKEDAEELIKAAQDENLEAYEVATVTDDNRMVMKWRGEEICSLSRDFLNSNGAKKETDVKVLKIDEPVIKKTPSLKTIASSLKAASRRGLVERFDGTIGAGSVLMPFGGKFQRTPEQVMAALLPVLAPDSTDQATVMSYGFDPDWRAEWDEGEISIYDRAAFSVINAIAKVVASGADYKTVYLSLQEFFEHMGEDPARWGKPFQALLGALDTQLAFECAAIGGKDSMSGSFLDYDVPPTLVAFAVAPIAADEIISSSFKGEGNPVYAFSLSDNPEEIKASWENYNELVREGKVLSSRALETGGIAEAVIQMSFGNEVGFKSKADENLPWYEPSPSTIVAELSDEIDDKTAVLIGYTTDDKTITIGNDSEAVDELLKLNEAVLKDVYITETDETGIVKKAEDVSGRKPLKRYHGRPSVVMPVFPGTNCEYDTIRAFSEAGLDSEAVVIKNQTKEDLNESAKTLREKIDSSQILFIPGGFSGGDEPEGSGKFIASFLRNPEIADSIMRLLDDRDGLILGICNGFQALIKLGLLPYGKITETTSESPTLTYNTIGRHQSRIVNTVVSSKLSPWLKKAEKDVIYRVPISHGEGRFIAPQNVLDELSRNGQIATQYVDFDMNPTMDSLYNPNGSLLAVEGITSLDGRIFGKMGHNERVGKNLYKNVPGNYEMGLFESAREYFKN